MEEKKEKKSKKPEVKKVEEEKIVEVIRVKDPVLPKLKVKELRLGDGIVITQDNWSFKLEAWLKNNRPEVYKKYVK